MPADGTARQASWAYSLASLLDPLGPEVFFRDYWGQQCCLVSGRDPGTYKRLFCTEDVDSVLSLTGLGPQGTYQVVKSEHGRTVDYGAPEGGGPEFIAFITPTALQARTKRGNGTPARVDGIHDDGVTFRCAAFLPASPLTGHFPA
jgi:hypothetical protein